jgi:hypothetical protein
VTPPRRRHAAIGVEHASGGETFYRLVRSDPPPLDGFRSQRELAGRRPPRPDALYLLTVGVSMFDTLDGVLKVARRRPAFVAEVALKPGRGISFAQTGQPGPPHDLGVARGAARLRC